MNSANRRKHENRNPIQRMLIKRFQRRLFEILGELRPADLLEVGTGEGFLLDKVHAQFPMVRLLGLEVDEVILADGRSLFPHLDLRKGNIYHLEEFNQSWDIVLCSEVLEHLDRPMDGLKELARVAQRAAILSVPHEPWFRLSNLARGRHLARFGNHPEHVNLWSQRGFVAFVQEQLDVQQVVSSFPWTIVVAYTRK